MSMPVEEQDQPLNPHAPNHNLELDYVFGYRTVGSKHSVKYSSDGLVLFIQASLCAIMDTSNDDSRS